MDGSTHCALFLYGVSWCLRSELTHFRELHDGNVLLRGINERDAIVNYSKGTPLSLRRRVRTDRQGFRTSPDAFLRNTMYTQQFVRVKLIRTLNAEDDLS